MSMPLSAKHETLRNRAREVARGYPSPKTSNALSEWYQAMLAPHLEELTSTQRPDSPLDPLHQPRKAAYRLGRESRRGFQLWCEYIPSAQRQESINHRIRRFSSCSYPFERLQNRLEPSLRPVAVQHNGRGRSLDSRTMIFIQHWRTSRYSGSNSIEGAGGSEVLSSGERS